MALSTAGGRTPVGDYAASPISNKESHVLSCCVQSGLLLVSIQFLIDQIPIPK